MKVSQVWNHTFTSSHINLIHSPLDHQQAVYAVRHINRPTFATNPKVVPASGTQTSDRFVPHVQVGVSRLHDQGYLCQGIRIAVIDTGCDCSHPALGGGFGVGHKITKGYDFVGDDYNGSNDPQPDDNPCTQCAVSLAHLMDRFMTPKILESFNTEFSLSIIAEIRFFFFSSSFHLSFLSFMELIPWASWPPTRTTWDSVECVPRRRCRPTGFLVVRKERVMTWLWRLCWEHIRMEVWLWVPQLPRTSRECWWA